MLILMPMAFMSAWNSCSISARTELPVVVEMLNVRSLPASGPELGW